jgi:hypothetical protein
VCVCVCVCARARACVNVYVGVGARARTCACAHVALHNHHKTRCHIVFCGLFDSTTFFDFISYTTRFSGKSYRTKMCVFIFSTTFIWNISYFKKKSLISNFIKIRPVGAEFFHADGRTQTDMSALSLFAVLWTRLKNYSPKSVTVCTTGIHLILLAYQKASCRKDMQPAWREWKCMEKWLKESSGKLPLGRTGSRWDNGIRTVTETKQKRAGWIKLHPTAEFRSNEDEGRGGGGDKSTGFTKWEQLSSYWHYDKTRPAHKVCQMADSVAENIQ